MSGAFPKDITDHYPIFAVLNIKNNRKPIKKLIRDHSEHSLTALANSLTALMYEFDLFIKKKNVDDQTKWLVDTLWEKYDYHCPTRTKTISYKSIIKPWIDQYLNHSIKEKHRLFKAYKLNRVPFEVYNNYKNRITKETKKAKANYYKKSSGVQKLTLKKPGLT